MNILFLRHCQRHPTLKTYSKISFNNPIKMNNDYIRDFNLFQSICRQRHLIFVGTMNKCTTTFPVNLKTSNRLVNTSKMIWNTIFELKRTRFDRIEEADSSPIKLCFFCLVIMLSQHVKIWLNVRWNDVL